MFLKLTRNPTINGPYLCRPMRRYELIEHTADIGVKATGRDLEEAFAVAAEAMFEIITDKAPIEPSEEVTLQAESIDTEGLLVDFLSRLIVVHEVDNMVFNSFTVSFTGEHKLVAVGKGERFISEKHGHGHHVKGVSYHMMEIFDGRNREESYVQVLFDV